MYFSNYSIYNNFYTKMFPIPVEQYSNKFCCYISPVFFHRFPAKYYCTLFGICIGLGGVVSFFQYPLLTLEQEAFGGDQNYVRALLLNYNKICI